MRPGLKTQCCGLDQTDNVCVRCGVEVNWAIVDDTRFFVYSDFRDNLYVGTKQIAHGLARGLFGKVDIICQVKKVVAPYSKLYDEMIMNPNALAGIVY